MIKQRNLSGSLVQWIMAQTSLGPGIGEIKYVAPEASSTSQFRTQLQALGAEDEGKVYLTPATAFATMTGYRNDVMLVAPGAYNATAALAWSTPQTHMIGMGGPNQGGDYAEPNCVLYTDTAAVGSVLTITGYNCQFHNMTIQNAGDANTNLTAVTLSKYSNYFKNVAMVGTMVTSQLDVVAAASLYVGANAYNSIFEDCIMGTNVWGTRAGALSGVIRFTNTASSSCPQNLLFNRCRVLSAAETVTVAMVAMPANYCLDRIAEFRDCTFHNYSVNDAIKLNQVFYDACGTSHSVLLTGSCAAIGIDEWQDADGGNTRIGSTMPIVGTGGGLARNPTSITGS
jgi:hypothetical protein